MALEFLNEIKKENKEIRREQNKRYRQKNREILNLKKTAHVLSNEFRKKTGKNTIKLKQYP